MQKISAEFENTTVATPSPSLNNEGLLTTLLAFAVVLVIMNTAMFNLALPDVTETFHLSATVTSLIVTGYSIMFAISSITFSRLSDFLPIRRLLAIGLTTLGIAAIAGLFSPSFWILLAVRVVQASGAGAVVSLSLVTLSRYVPIERRGKAMALIMSAVSLGLGLGRRIFRLEVPVRHHGAHAAVSTAVSSEYPAGTTGSGSVRYPGRDFRGRRHNRFAVVSDGAFLDGAGVRCRSAGAIRLAYPHRLQPVRLARVV